MIARSRAIPEGELMPSLDEDGEDMLILAKFAKREATASLAGRRTREARPLAAADRLLIARPSTKSSQLNLKVTPEFHGRVSALAIGEGIPMVELVIRAVDAYARTKESWGNGAARAGLQSDPGAEHHRRQTAHSRHQDLSCLASPRQKRWNTPTPRFYTTKTHR
jgi:hypothetical protein